MFGYRPPTRVVSYPAPSAVVISVQEMKRHLRVDDSFEEADIERWTLSAMGAVEKYTQRLLTPRTVTMRLPGLPSGRRPVELFGGVVASVTSVTIAAEPFTDFEVVGDSPALMFPDADWPVLQDMGGLPVTIVYVAGFAAVPADLAAAVKLICGSLYRDRENSAMGAQANVSVDAQYLMRPHRIRPL